MKIPLSLRPALLPLLLLFSSSQLASSHTDPHSDSHHDGLIEDYSLKNMLGLSKLPDTFITEGSSRLEEGRLILTPGTNTRGSLWLGNVLPIDQSFTIEWTFRSVGYSGKTTGGLSFWFLNDWSSDNELYGGPSKFSGLHLLVDNNGAYGPALRAQLSDGSVKTGKGDINKEFFAACLFPYQDVATPTTLRLSYDIGDNHLLKVQIDNRVCFQTRRVRLIPREAGTQSVQLGVSADNGDGNNEAFEILGVRVFDKVVDQAYIPNVHQMPQPKRVTKVINKGTGEEKLLDKDTFRSKYANDVSNYELFKKLNRIEGKVLANDISNLEATLDGMIDVQDKMIESVAQFNLLVEQWNLGMGPDSASTKDLANEFKDFLSMNEKLEKLLESQEKLREETRRELEAESQEGGNYYSSITKKMAMWLIPLSVIMSVMTYLTIRTRQDLKKLKWT